MLNRYDTFVSYESRGIKKIEIDIRTSLFNIQSRFWWNLLTPSNQITKIGSLDRSGIPLFAQCGTVPDPQK